MFVAGLILASLFLKFLIFLQIKDFFERNANYKPFSEIPEELSEFFQVKNRKIRKFLSELFNRFSFNGLYEKDNIITEIYLGDFWSILRAFLAVGAFLTTLTIVFLMELFVAFSWLIIFISMYINFK